MSIAVSGGFDPFHVGHLDYIEGAAYYGDVIVILNSDDWLIRKKGYCFMPWKERARLLKALRGVGSVEAVDDKDGSVCEALVRLRPTFFANGGDRKEDNTLELDLCRKIGVTPIFNVGGSKTASSSEIVEAAWKKKNS